MIQCSIYMGPYLRSGHEIHEQEPACFPLSLQCAGDTEHLILILTLCSAGNSYVCHRKNILLCAVLHRSSLHWQKAQLNSMCVFCKKWASGGEGGGGLLVCVWVSGAIHSVSHVFLDISAYTENDTWTVQAIFRIDSFSFHSDNCFFNTVKYAKCFNKLLIRNGSNGETKRKL